MIYKGPDGPEPESKSGERKCGICGERVELDGRFCGFCEQQLAEEAEAELRDWESRQAPGLRK